MTTRTILSLGLSALVFGGTMVGCTAGSGGIASASSGSATADAKGASVAAQSATKALQRHDAVAVGFAERAVALQPRQADYRMLLGQSYLQAGRFASAGQAFADVLTLTPDKGKAALNLALTQIATGDWQGARRTLADHATTIPASDRGLAMALAGDTAGAVELLTAVARSPEASAKVRQNLALSLALAGQWQIARVVAAADMSPADVDARLQQWAAFAQPHAASDQVASLLGVKAASDTGQPVALALTAPVSVTPTAAEAVAALPAVPLPAPAAVAAPVSVEVATRQPGVSFGPRREVVQQLPAVLIARPTGAIKVAVQPVAAGKPAAKAVPAIATGEWYVQLGAYDSAGVAHDAWARAKRRYAAFAGHQPNGVAFKSQAGSFYRLSVGGFSRADADTACRQYRTRGGACFVRRGAGDALAQWVRPAGVQVAAR